MNTVDTFEAFKKVILLWAVFVVIILICATIALYAMGEFRSYHWGGDNENDNEEEEEPGVKKEIRTRLPKK